MASTRIAILQRVRPAILHIFGAELVVVKPVYQQPYLLECEKEVFVDRFVIELDRMLFLINIMTISSSQNGHYSMVRRKTDKQSL